MRRVSSIAVIGVAAGIIVAFWWASREADAPASGPATSAARPDASDAAPAVAPSDSAAVQTGQRYEIDAGQSEVYWRIYRSGPAARLGHSHVISMSDVSGSVTLAEEFGDSAWELRFPVDALIIDDPELRARYGEEFESVPSDEDKAGTKTNMLSDRLLNGAVFGEISLQGQGFSGTLAAASLPVSIQIAGQTIEQAFPAEIVIGEESVIVTGEHRLTHADLGLEPYTAFGGMIAVGADIDFTYRIYAIAVGQ